YLPPLAMVNTIPPAEAFAARPDWILQVARSALRILFNSIMIGVKKKVENVDFVQQVLQDVKAAVAKLSGDDGRDLSHALALELEKQGSPTTLPQLKAFLEAAIGLLARKCTLVTLLGIEEQVGQIETMSGPASSLEDYNQLFQLIPLPAVSQKFREDSEFAAM